MVDPLLGALPVVAPSPQATSPDAWGQPITAERESELEAILADWDPSALNQLNRKSAFDAFGRSVEEQRRFRLTGADVFWLAQRHRPDQLGRVPDLHLEGANLVEAILAGADLRTVHLEGAYLRKAQLVRADLRGAYFEGANLHGAYVQYAELRGASLKGATLYGAYFENADLIGADLESANLNAAHLESADLRGRIQRHQL